MHLVRSLLILLVAGTSLAVGRDGETLPALKNGQAPQNFDQMWAGFDPRAEPLEIEVLEEWEENGVVLQVLRYRIGVFKGRKAMMAAVYGYPKGQRNLPGLVQIHGGGQYADYRACLANAKRGYATISLAWAGRISAPDYRVTPAEVKLFWEGKTDDPNYRVTTDWGAVDGYHAPGRNPGNVFPSAKAASWTLDDVESPRNSGWFLCALGARRALTFLERQPEVDADRLGVYGHSMGGKLTVMTAADPRVKAAAPSCGGISDRHNNSAIYRATLGDDVSLKKITCPIVFLSPSNDFHGHIRDLPKAIAEINTDQWRVTCSPHHNHQDTPPYEVATMLWMDQHLKNSFSFPQTPETTLALNTDDGVPRLRVQPDRSGPILSVDVFFTQHGKVGDEPEDMEEIKHRVWHYAKVAETDKGWMAKLPLADIKKPLWVYANITYPLDDSVSGAGYYYGIYTAQSFNVSSLLQVATPAELAAAGSRATRKPSRLIESFQGDWEKEWFTYKPEEWARSTHKIGDDTYAAPEGASLAIDVLAKQPNTLVVLIDDDAAEVPLTGGNEWQTVLLQPQDFHDINGEPLASWRGITRLKLTPAERLKPKRGSEGKLKRVGKAWKGTAPQFRDLRWTTGTFVQRAAKSTDCPRDRRSLKTAVGDRFKIGVGVGQHVLLDPDNAELTKRHFEILTPENCMKPQSVHPAENEWSFETADRFANFARVNNLEIVGHCLVWAKDDRTDPWMMREKGKPVTRDTMLRRIETHVATVVRRYADVATMWDVVNEAIGDGEGDLLRDSVYSRTTGIDFIVTAFQAARANDPDALLIYNDYNCHKPGKRKKLIELLTELKRRGAPVDAYGMQGHFELGGDSIPQLRETFADLRKLGVKVAVSELDIDVVTRGRWWADGGKYREELATYDPYKDGLPEDIQQKQTAQYVELFKLFDENRDIIVRVSFWNLHDGQSWLNDFPWKRVNYPLLFDRQRNAKPVFDAVFESLQPRP